MAIDSEPWVTSCLLCGRADETANMVRVAVEHRAPWSPAVHVICQECCSAVMEAIRSELADFNAGVKNDADFHFGLGDGLHCDPVDPDVAVPAAFEEAPRLATDDGSDGAPAPGRRKRRSAAVPE